jgi:transcription elongation factor Elf1
MVLVEKQMIPERENPLPTVDPCPFCAKLHWSLQWDDVGATWVQCCGCGARGPKTIPSCKHAILAWNERAAALERGVWVPSVEDIRGAVARGWCHPDNGHKIMDVDLANAITAEIVAMIAAAPVSYDEKLDVLAGRRKAHLG